MLRAQLALVLLVLAVPHAAGQSSMKLDVQVDPPNEPLAEGEAGKVRFTITRMCANVVQVAPETELVISISASGMKVEGPPGVPMPQHVCASAPPQTAEATYEVTLPASMPPASTIEVQFTVSDTADGTPISPAAEPYSGSFALAKLEAPANDTLQDLGAGEAPAQEAPSLGVLLVFVALAGAAMRVRRRP